MRKALSLMMFVMVTSCTIPLRDAAVYDVYSRAEIDAMVLRQNCLNNARTLVQAARCNSGRLGL